ncbi:TPA: hypothetical protein ACH3X1_016733 [Trebouxia sp. C0004]
MVVCACNNPNRRGCSRTVQGIVMGAAQMLTQGFDNCTNLQNRDSATVKRHGLPNRLQTSSYGARKVLSTIPNRKSIIKIVKQDYVEKRPNRTSSYLAVAGKWSSGHSCAGVPKLKCLLPQKILQWRQPQLLKQHCTRRSILDPTDVPQVSVIDGLQSNPCLLCLATGGMHAPQLTAIMQRGYKDALQEEELEVDCAATLQLRMPLLHHSPRARRLCLQRCSKVGDTP